MIKPYVEKKERRMGLERGVEQSKRLFLDIFSKIFTGETRYSLRQEHFFLKNYSSK